MKELVLVASSDGDLQRKVAHVLNDDFSVEFCANAQGLSDKVRIQLPSLICIDVPHDEEAREQYRKWVMEFKNSLSARKVPVLLFSDSIDETKWLLALSLGASDFILKPLNERELRIRAIGLTRAPSALNKLMDIFECGNLKLNTASYEVRVNDQVVALSVLEFNLLRYFVNNKERVLAREQVISAVWPNSEVLDRAVDTHVVSLRRKLIAWDYSIVTVYRAGYILKKEDH